MVAYSPRFWPGTDIRWVEANSRPAALVSAHGDPVALLTADVSERGIERLLWVVNPAKLAPYVASLAG
jgi:RNA polymerase sigma-70 factor (ECF subfamily)